jgi:hypothetical protein
MGFQGSAKSLLSVLACRASPLSLYRLGLTNTLTRSGQQSFSVRPIGFRELLAVARLFWLVVPLLFTVLYSLFPAIWRLYWRLRVEQCLYFIARFTAQLYKHYKSLAYPYLEVASKFLCDRLFECALIVTVK